MKLILTRPVLLPGNRIANLHPEDRPQPEKANIACQADLAVVGVPTPQQATSFVDAPLDCLTVPRTFCVSPSRYPAPLAALHVGGAVASALKWVRHACEGYDGWPHGWRALEAIDVLDRALLEVAHEANSNLYGAAGRLAARLRELICITLERAERRLESAGRDQQTWWSDDEAAPPLAPAVPGPVAEFFPFWSEDLLAEWDSVVARLLPADSDLAGVLALGQAAGLAELGLFYGDDVAADRGLSAFFSAARLLPDEYLPPDSILQPFRALPEAVANRLTVGWVAERKLLSLPEVRFDLAQLLSAIVFEIEVFLARWRDGGAVGREGERQECPRSVLSSSEELTTREAAAYLKVSIDTLNAHVRVGRLPRRNVSPRGSSKGPFLYKVGDLAKLRDASYRRAVPQSKPGETNQRRSTPPPVEPVYDHLRL